MSSEFEGVEAVVLVERLAAKLAAALRENCYLEVVRDQAREVIATQLRTIETLEYQLERYEKEEPCQSNES